MSERRLEFEGYSILERQAEGQLARLYEAFRPKTGVSIGIAPSHARIKARIRQDIIQQKAKNGELPIVKVKLSQLYPLESGFVEEVVAGYRTSYEAGEPVDIPEAVKVGEDFLITEGTHRVFAQKLLQRDEIEVILVPDERPEVSRRIIEKRKSENRGGFENLDKFADETERRDAQRRDGV